MRLSTFSRVTFKLLLVAVALILFLFIILQTSFFKNQAAGYVAKYLRDNYQLRVEIPSWDYRAGSILAITLKNFRIYGGPRQADVFLQANLIEARIPYSSLWSDPFFVDLLTLDSPQLYPKNLPSVRRKTEQQKEGRGFQIRKINITGGGFEYLRLQVRELVLDASVDSYGVLLRDVHARLADGELQADGALYGYEDPRYKLRYAFSGKAERFRQLIETLPPLSGSIQTTGEISGSREFYKVSGTAETKSLSLYNEAPFSANANYNIDTRNRVAPYEFQASWRSMPASVARKFSAKIPLINSTINGSGTYEGTKDFWGAVATAQLDIIPRDRKSGVRLGGVINAKLADRAIHISDTSLRLARSLVQISGKVLPKSLQLHAKAQISSLSDLAFLQPKLGQLPGRYIADASIEGPFQSAITTFRIVGSDPGMRLVSNGSYHFSSSSIDAGFEGEISGAAMNRIYPADLSGQFTLHGKVSGAISHPRLTASVFGESVWVRETDLGNIQLQVQSNGQVLEANADLPEIATSGVASYRFADHDYTLRAQFADLSIDELRHFLPQTARDVTGKLSGSFQASGDARFWRSSKAVLDLQEASLQRGDLQVDLQTGSVLTMQNRIVSVDLNAKMTKGTFHLSGSIPLTAQKQLDLHATGEADLQMLSLFTDRFQADGIANLDVAIAGTFDHPKYTGRLTTQNLTLKSTQPPVELTNGKVTADIQDRQAFVDITASVNGSPMTAKGTVPLQKDGNLNVRVKGQSDLKNLTLFTNAAEGSGIVDLDILISGSASKPHFSGAVHSEKFQLNFPDRHLALTDATVTANFNDDRIQLSSSGLLNNSQFTVSGTLPLTETAGEIHGSLQNLAVSSLVTDANISGAVDVIIDARGTGRKLATWSGDVSVMPKQLQIGEYPVSTLEPLRIGLTSGMAELHPIRLRAENALELSAEGKVNFRTNNISGNIQAQTELSLLTNFLTNVVADGKMQADLHIDGNLDNPTLTGVVRVQDGFFRRFQSPLLLEHIQLVAPIEQNKITLQTFTAQMGGGSIQGSGTIGLSNWKPSDMQLTFQARNVGMVYPEDLRSQLNADLKLTSEGNDYVLAGDVRILRSIYREDIDPRQRLINSLLRDKQALAPPSLSGSRFRLDLNIATVDDLVVRNNLGRLLASADLQVTGYSIEPRVSGRVRVRERSEIFFEGNRFEVQRGIIDFYGKRRIDPVFDLELFTIARDVESGQDYEIILPISGPSSKLDDRQPTSYPPLSSDQIYFLLLTGHADAQLTRASSRFFQQQLASYISGQVFSGVQREVAHAFGLTRVELQPELISSETDPGAKLVLGKDFSSALSLVYSISLTESSDQTWIAYYRAPKNLTFRFVDQQNGSYTTSARHLVRFGEGVSTGTLRSGRRPRTRQIGTVRISNESILSDAEIQNMLGLQQGDEYDYWDAQTRLEKLEEDLQGRGYLFASAMLQETQRNGNIVDLVIKIQGREKREMEFQGSDISSAQHEKYLRFWREGFSETAILELIREDVVRRLWFQGYHQASVKKETQRSGDTIVHTFTIQPGTLFSNSTLVFEGIDAAEAENLQKDLQDFYGSQEEMITDAVHNFDAFERKITALHVQQGYLTSKASPAQLIFEGNRMERRILITKGPQSRIQQIVISDGQQFTEELKKKLNLKEGSIYQPREFMEDQLRVEEYFENRGYRKVQLEAEPQRKAGGPDLILLYNLRTGEIAHVASIHISGNRHTQTKLIEKRINLKRGEILNQEKLVNAQKNLTELRIFHQATVRAEESDTPGQYDIIVDVMERRHYEMAYGGRYDTDRDAGAEVQLTDLNLFGTGQSLSFYTRVDQRDQLYRLVYHSPTLSGLRWKTLISTSYENGELLLLERERFEGHKIDFNIQRQKDLTGTFVLLSNYQFEYLTLTPLESPDIRPVEGLKISRIIGTLFSDTRDDPLNANRGAFLAGDVQYAAGFLGSDVSYIKNFNQYYRFMKIGKMVLASAVRLGLATNLENRLITERFFAGGSFTIRGFQKDAVGPVLPTGQPLGGEALFILNEEIRFPVAGWFGGAAFYDAGNVYASVSDFNPFRLRHSIGLGLRIKTPFGIGRFDYGFNVARRDSEPLSVLHFSLGQAF